MSFFRPGFEMALRSFSLFLRNPGKALLMTRMSFWVISLTALVRLLPLPRVMQIITPGGKSAPAPANIEELQVRLAETLDTLLRMNWWVFTPTCWKRAPVLYRYLLLNGVETQVVFGMRKEGEGVLAGHAWLEANGRPVLEDGHPSYAVTFVFPNRADGTRVSA